MQRLRSPVALSVTAAVVVGVFAGALSYGMLQQSASTATADHRPAARAQVSAILRTTLSTYASFQSARTACGSNITCLYTAAGTALTRQAKAAASVDLSLYTTNEQNVALQNFLTPVEAIEKAYLKASQTISLTAFQGDLAGLASSVNQATYFANLTLQSLK
jgi:hypothetical protein